MTNTLNQGQKDAAQAFFDFLLTTDPFFVISGAAGCGKTFLMDHLSNKGIDMYLNTCRMLGLAPEFDEIHFTATTNKAAEVLEKSIGKPVQTIHSFLALKVRENYSNGKTSITKTDRWKVRENCVIFIDETSMIDTPTFNIILESFRNSKIVFVGDHSQMAPVSEPLSPVYATVPAQNFVVLTEPVRNASSPALMALCDQLRETVETGVFKPLPNVPGIINHLDSDQMEAELTSEFVSKDPSSRILCYTNERVVDYNSFIREDVRQLSSQICVGDVLVVASAYANGKTNLSVESEILITDVGPILEDNQAQDVIGKSIKYREVDLQTTNGMRAAQKVRVAVNPNDRTTAIQRYARQKNWGAYFDLKASYLDVRDKAACTVYKSQGSSYDSVFIDLGNLGTSYDPQQAARMLYVGVSRARFQVNFYGDLPSRYHDSKGKQLWIPTVGQIGSQTSSSPKIRTALMVP